MGFITDPTTKYLVTFILQCVQLDINNNAIIIPP